ncbi:MAG: hypothetical protein ACJA2U_001146 [Marinomonas primoryensis]
MGRLRLKGYLNVDGYQARIDPNNASRLLSHARRKFIEAEKSKSGKATISASIIVKI